MSDEGISDRVKRFIATYISSVAQLETLLLLHTNVNQSWSAADIARELRIEAGGAETQLAALVASGLAVRVSDTEAARAVSKPGDTGPRYRYNPGNPDVEADTVALAQAYLIRRVTVVGLIFAKPPDKVRAFSEAFRFRQDSRKDPPNG
ncbi:MAG TPA: hypothetical protein VH253_15535 [Phycisphaerae bacterium]|nr:hypothetical protein [Phycisphaerae bacterium]